MRACLDLIALTNEMPHIVMRLEVQEKLSAIRAYLEQKA